VEEKTKGIGVTQLHLENDRYNTGDGDYFLHTTKETTQLRDTVTTEHTNRKSYMIYQTVEIDYTG